MWQASIGVSCFITFVVVPMWFEYIVAWKQKHFIGNSSKNVDIKQMVYEKRIAVRKALDEKNS